MRQLVVELSGEELVRRVEASVALRQLKEFEVLHMLRYDRNEFAAICRIVPKDPRARAEQIFRFDAATSEIQVLKRGESASIILLKRLPRARRPGPPGPLLFGGEVTKPGAGYLLSPLSYRDGRLRFTFVGNQRQLNDILRRARSRGIQFRVVALTEADFTGSMLDRLTNVQRTVLLRAHQLGYYDVPRRARSADVAKNLGLSSATVVEHLRKAEKRLLDVLLTS
jgi:hypothetical protein